MPDVDLISLRFGRDLGGTPPLGPLCLGGSLQAAGLTWRLTDCQLDSTINQFSIEALCRVIRTLDAPVLGLSLFNDAIPLVIATLEAMSDELRGRRVFVGGPG